MTPVQIASLGEFVGKLIMVIGGIMLLLDRRGGRPGAGRAGGRLLGGGAIIYLIFNSIDLMNRFVY